MNISIIYDGQCPVCQRLIMRARLKTRSDDLDLIDARKLAGDIVQGQDISHIDFNEGFAVIVDGKLHQGANAAYVLSMLTQSSEWLFRIFKWLSKSPLRSRITYPVLKTGRRLLLNLLRVPMIKH